MKKIQKKRGNFYKCLLIFCIIMLYLKKITEKIKEERKL